MDYYGRHTELELHWPKHAASLPYQKNLQIHENPQVFAETTLAISLASTKEIVIMPALQPRKDEHSLFLFAYIVWIPQC